MTLEELMDELENEVVISVRCDDLRRGQDRKDQLRAVVAARKVARSMKLSFNMGPEGMYDVDASSVTVPATELDEYLQRLGTENVDRITAVYGPSDHELSEEFKSRLRETFPQNTLDL